MAAEDIPQTQNAFWGGLFSVLGPKLSYNADNARKLKDMQAGLYQKAIMDGHLKPEEIQYALGQIGKIYNDPNSKQILQKLSTGVAQHIQSEGQQQPGQGQPQGQPQTDQSQPPKYGIPGGAGGAIPGGALPGAGGASPGGTMMAQAALPPPVALQQPVGGGGQAPPAQTTGGGPLPPPQMPAAPQPTAAQTLQPPAGLTSGGVLASAFPNPYAREDFVDQREHKHALEESGKTAKQAAQIAREEDEKDYKIWLERGKEVLGPKASPRDLAEFAGTHGKKLPPVPSGANQRPYYVKRPGSDVTEPAFVDRVAKSGYVDIHGEDMPEGTTLSAAPREEVSRVIAGYYAYWRGQGLSDKDAKAKAGEDYRQRDQERLGRTLQQGDIDQAISGIGMRSGFTNPTIHTNPTPVAPPVGASSTATTPSATAPPVTKNGINKAAPATGTATPMANRVLGAPSANNPLGLSQRDIDTANFTVGVLTGLQKGTGKAAAQTIQGQKVLARVGVTPEEVTARNEQRVAARKTIDKLAPIAEAVSALDNALARHGTLLMNLRPQLPSTDITKLNEWLQSGAREFNVTGVSPAAVQVGIAMQAVRNEYARIIEGSGASVAGTSVQAMKDAGDKMRSGFTTGNMQAMLSMIDAEAKNKYGGYGDKLKELQQRMSEPLVPELKGGKYQPVIPDIPKPVPQGITAPSGKAPKTAQEYLQSIGR